MQFSRPLIKGTILKRYKRFLADIELESGELVVAHVANTGSMKTCWEPGWKVLVSHHDDPKRKLKYSLEMTHNGKTWICVNTSLPNKLAIEAIENGTIRELQGYKSLKPEAKIGDSRIDILLHQGDNPKDPEGPCYVEVKNVTLISSETHKDKEIGIFPDSVSTRGQKHLRELTALAHQGIRAAMLYVVNRQDVYSFAPAQDIDPEYAKLLLEARAAGVEILAYQASLTPKGIDLKNSLPIIL